jgi:hypothetical protein
VDFGQHLLQVVIQEARAGTLVRAFFDEFASSVRHRASGCWLAVMPLTPHQSDILTPIAGFFHLAISYGKQGVIYVAARACENRIFQSAELQRITTTTKRIKVGNVTVVEPDMDQFFILYPRFDKVKRVEMPYQQLHIAREQSLDHDHHDQYEQRQGLKSGEFPLPVVDLSGGKEITFVGWSTYDELVKRRVTLIPVLLAQNSAREPRVPD